MIENRNKHILIIASHALTVLGAFILAIHPILWLVGSWTDASYDSDGLWVFLFVFGLFLWSISSEKNNDAGKKKYLALILLLCTALVRLIGQVLAINIIGAVALVIDIYAIGLLMNLSSRRRSLSAGWLAIIFAFSLPLERVIQRTIGYILQHISADGSCFILSSIFESVHCEGIRILINNKDVLVDLPCSGAHSTLLLLLLYSAFMALYQPSLKQGIIGLILTGITALIANVIRITMLAIGIAYPSIIFDIDVMQSPWHDLMGIIALIIGAMPVLFCAYRIKEKTEKHTSFHEAKNHNKTTASYITSSEHYQLIIAVLFIIIACIIINIPKKPIDISRTYETISLPNVIGNHIGTPIKLRPKEEAYFTQFGGAAAKMQFGDRSLMVVKTSAPLRHLHAPDECLRGMGFKVTYKGLSHAVIPTAIYKATAPDDSTWRIAVSFVSENGYITTNVSEAVWRWLQNPNEDWSAIQRISPWDEEESSLNQWDKDIVTALDLYLSPQTTQPKQFQSYQRNDT